MRAAVLDAGGRVVYVAQHDGAAAYAIAGPDGAAGATPLWRLPLPDVPVLLALDDGGVAIAAVGDLRAVGADGAERWRVDDVGDVPVMAAQGRWLVLGGAGRAGAWSVGSGPEARRIVRPGLPGTPTVAGDSVFVIAAGGVTWLSLVAAEPPRTVPLAAATSSTTRSSRWMTAACWWRIAGRTCCGCCGSAARAICAGNGTSARWVGGCRGSCGPAARCSRSAPGRHHLDRPVRRRRDPPVRRRRGRRAGGRAVGGGARRRDDRQPRAARGRAVARVPDRGGRGPALGTRQAARGPTRAFTAPPRPAAPYGS
ncbi:MAG: hypothetical protein U0470_03735 [Anaerolineae bacterium]